MKKRIILFFLIFLLSINFASASLCKDDYGNYRDCNDINYNNNNYYYNKVIKNYDDNNYKRDYDRYVDNRNYDYNDRYKDNNVYRYRDDKYYQDSYDNRYNQDRYNIKYQDNYDDRIYIIHDDLRSSPKTYYVVYENGRSHYRTYDSYNKYLKDNRKYDKYTNFRQIGIYRDFYDYKNIPDKRTRDYFDLFKFEKTYNCPDGWSCLKGDRITSGY